MNYFYSNSKKKKLGKIIEQPIFSEFVAYMYENQQHEIILRELKTKFPQKKFEHFLDQLIEEKLVLRENRRYMLNFPIFNNEKDLTESQNITNELLPQLRELSQEEQQLAMGEEVWRYCFEGEEDYFYGTTADILLVNKVSAGNEEYQFISVNREKELPVTLANYFYIQKEQLPMPKNFTDLAHTIGDVNESYFFDQIEVILERIQKQKYKKRRPSIFFDALVLSATIETNEIEEIRLPIFHPSEEKIVFPVLDTKIVPAERAHIKRKVNESLIAKLSLTDYSYILEKR